MTTTQDERATLTLTIEGARFNDMDMARVGEIFGLLGEIAGKDSVLVRLSSQAIIVQEGSPGSASVRLPETEDVDGGG